MSSERYEVIERNHHARRRPGLHGPKWPMEIFVCGECGRPTMFVDDICCSGLDRPTVLVMPVIDHGLELEENDMLLEELDLTSRAYNALRRHGIHTVNELCGWTRSELYAIPNLGQGSLDVIEDALERVDRSLVVTE